jgi:hypothetical protein
VQFYIYEPGVYDEGVFIMETELITLPQALRQLRMVGETDPDELADISDKMRDAVDIVLRHLKVNPLILPWSGDSIPGAVREAILIVLANLYDDRAAGRENYAIEPDSVLAHMLSMYRDPAMG